MIPKSNNQEDTVSGIDDSLSMLTLDYDARAKEAYKDWVNAFIAFRRHPSLDNVKLATSKAHRLCDILHEDDPRLPESLHNLAALLLQQSSIAIEGQSANIQVALRVSRRAVDLAERQGRAPSLTQLSDLHMSLMMLSGADNPNPSHLDQAIDVGTRLVELAGAKHPDAAMHHSNLAASYRRRHQHSGNKIDLTAAITSARHAASIVPIGGGVQFQACHNLGLFCLDMFDITRATKDLEEALHARWSAINALPAGHSAILQYLVENVSIIDANSSHVPEFSNLDILVDILQTALVAIANDHPRIEEHALDLATALYIRYGRSGLSVDLDVAIEVLRLSISLHAPDSVHLPRPQFMLCIMLEDRYDLHGLSEDLDTAIAACVEATSHGDVPIKQLEKLVALLTQRYASYDRIEDLERLILYVTRIVAKVPEGDSKKAKYMRLSGLFFAELYPRMGRIELLNLSTGAFQEAAKRLHPDTDGLERAGCLNSLAGSYRTQYYVTGEQSLLKLAIKTQREAIVLIGHDSVLAVGYASNLSLLMMLAGELGDGVDVMGLLDDQTAEAEGFPDEHEEKSTLLLNVALMHSRAYDASGDKSHLDAAVAGARRCLELMPLTRRDRHLVLLNAGSFFMQRFEREGDIADLDAAMEALEESTRRLHPSHPERAEHFVSLAQAHLTRFQRIGQVMDLDACIDLARRALEISIRRVFRAALLQTLGTALMKRFERLHDLDDLHAAVAALRDSLDSLPDAHEDRSIVLFSLSSALGSRFHKLRNTADLDEGVKAIQQAIDILPEGHPKKPLYLSYLGKFLGGLRFNATGDVAHLEAGVATERQALQLIDRSYAGRPRHLGDLSHYHEVRFTHTKNRSDIDTAIELLQEALAYTSEEDSSRPKWCFRLGCCLQARFQTYQDRNDLELAIQTMKSTFMSGILVTDPIVQFEAAHACGLLLRRHYSASESVPVFTSMIDLVPHVVWLGGKLSQRYADVKRVSSMIDDAISAAIDSQNASATLDWLEQSRCIVWSQVQSLHLPGIEQLRAADITLARDFEQVVHSLQGLATRANTGFGLLGEEASYRDIPVEDEGLIHRTLAARYTQLLEIARAIPGLAEFMRPEHFSRRVWTAISGPVVIVHPAEKHCDIVCILPLEPRGPGQATPNECFHIRLDTFTLKIAHSLRRKLLECLRAAGVSTRAVVPHSSLRRDDFELVLQKLWISLVKPIIDEIQNSYTFTGRAELPHLTWCLSGPVAFLPLHAAGLYDGTESEQPRAYDLFVSSYTPSLTALLDAHRRHGRRAKEVSPRVLAIAQPNTPGLSRLPGTTREVNILQGIVPVLDRLDGPEATRAAVLEAMKTHHWVHLACHGIQNGEDPTKSALRLHDGALELREMMRTSFPNAELAVLSACETATGDDTVPQEAVHLAAGMLMAGFESVVATSWSISDEDGPVLARELYTHLFKEGEGDVTRTAYALHHATKCLRERVGEKNFVRWLPFIHMGL